MRPDYIRGFLCICQSLWHVLCLVASTLQLTFSCFFPCSVQFSSSHGLQHARLPCPSPTPGVYSNSVPLSRWYHLTISSSFVPLSSRLQSSPASESFQMSQLFASGGQSIGALSISISPSNEHPGLISFRMMDWLDLLAIQGPLKSLQHHSSKAFSFLYSPAHILTWRLDPCVERNSQPPSGRLRAPGFCLLLRLVSWWSSFHIIYFLLLSTFRGQLELSNEYWPYCQSSAAACIGNPSYSYFLLILSLSDLPSP